LNVPATYTELVPVPSGAGGLKLPLAKLVAMSTLKVMKVLEA